jgi:hypothetical protein
MLWQAEAKIYRVEIIKREIYLFEINKFLACVYGYANSKEDENRISDPLYKVYGEKCLRFYRKSEIKARNEQWVELDFDFDDLS